MPAQGTVPPAHGQPDPRQDRRVRDHRHVPRPQRADPVVQCPHRQDPADGDDDEPAQQRVPPARPVRPHAEQRGQQQVEHHLIRQGPRDVRHIGAAEQVRQHQQVGGEGLQRVMLRAAQGAVAERVPHRGGDDRQHVQRVQPEPPADPKAPDRPLALQRRRDDVPADQEEHENAVLPEVEPLVQERVDRRHHQRGRVVEHDAQCREPAQRVQPRQPARWLARGRAGPLRTWHRARRSPGA